MSNIDGGRELHKDKIKSFSTTSPTQRRSCTCEKQGCGNGTLLNGTINNGRSLVSVVDCGLIGDSAATRECIT
ncbi:hypothetical protein VNO77_24845 [Canavalia gladiata]|uniref:Uncharacterized protein n=1 Tax=Canavalia gladiata TaxID=3824 RepID=A0AAN9QCZ9_CANGL